MNYINHEEVVKSILNRSISRYRDINQVYREVREGKIGRVEAAHIILDIMKDLGLPWWRKQEVFKGGDKCLEKQRGGKICPYQMPRACLEIGD